MTTNITWITIEGVVESGTADLFDRLRKKLADAGYYFTIEPIRSSEEKGVTYGKIKRGPENLVTVGVSYMYATIRTQQVANAQRKLNKGGILITNGSVFSEMAIRGPKTRLGIEGIWGLNKMALSGLRPNVVVYLQKDPKNMQLGRREFGVVTLVANGYQYIKRNMTRFGIDRWIDIDTNNLTPDGVFVQAVKLLLQEE